MLERCKYHGMLDEMQPHHHYERLILRSSRLVSGPGSSAIRLRLTASGCWQGATEWGLKRSISRQPVVMYEEMSAHVMSRITSCTTPFWKLGHTAQVVQCGCINKLHESSPRSNRQSPLYVHPVNDVGQCGRFDHTALTC